MSLKLLTTRSKIKFMINVYKIQLNLIWNAFKKQFQKRYQLKFEIILILLSLKWQMYFA